VEPGVKQGVTAVTPRRSKRNGTAWLDGENGTVRSATDRTGMQKGQLRLRRPALNDDSMIDFVTSCALDLS
jgi:hypothetical protein